MKTQDFDFNSDATVMPPDPLEIRGKSRDSGKMIVLNRSKGSIEHAIFTDICDYFRAGDLLVFNNSYMLSNTLSFTSLAGERFPLTVYGHESDGTMIIEVKSNEVAVKPGAVYTSVDECQLKCCVVEQQPDKLWKAKFEPPSLLIPTLDRYGLRVDENVHLNPTHWKDSPDAYRSVYAAKPGSLEIPSAGLHFSKELLAQAASKGVETAFITLHVGATEVLSVRHISEEEIENHKVRSEYFEVDDDAADKINRARAEGRRVIGVGTTVMRTLESIAQNRKAPIKAQKAWTDLYIYPGFKFNIIDVLLTNLPRPRSSHIVLTAAFAGKELVMRSYSDITNRGDYEFDMFGDSMLIV